MLNLPIRPERGCSASDATQVNPVVPLGGIDRKCDLAGASGPLQSAPARLVAHTAIHTTIRDYNADEDMITVILDDHEITANIAVTAKDGNSVNSLGDRVLAVVQGTAGKLTNSDIAIVSEEFAAFVLDPSPAEIRP